MESMKFKEKYSADKPENDSCELVFYCKTGVRSAQAVDIVKSLGYNW